MSSRLSWTHHRFAACSGAYVRCQGARREAARVCCRGRRACRMSWNSPSVVSILFGLQGSPASFFQSCLPRPRRCTTKTTAARQRAASPATMKFMVGRAEGSSLQALPARRALLASARGASMPTVLPACEQRLHSSAHDACHASPQHRPDSQVSSAQRGYVLILRQQLGCVPRRPSRSQ